MKATLDIPDDLYRRVKARSAMEGRPVRAVAVELFRDWLESKPPIANVLPPDDLSQAELDAHPWLAISRKYLKPGTSHDMDDIRAGIATGWGAEIAEKLNLIDPKR